MKTAGRILGTALFLEGYEVQDAPRYGAERRGAPMFSYVRAAQKPIRERGVIVRPDLIVVADESLLSIPEARVLSGIDEDSIIFIHSKKEEKKFNKELKLQAMLITSSTWAWKEDEIILSALCAGASARLLGIISKKNLKQAIDLEIGDMGKEILEENLFSALLAFDELKDYAGNVKESGFISFKGYKKPKWIEMPFEDARLSAPLIHAPATSMLMKTGAWRRLRPEIDMDICTKCGLCDLFCPDGCITLDQEGYPSIDYNYCKGCLICYHQCPVHAIKAVPEYRQEEN